MVELLKQSGLTTTDLSVQKTLSCRVLFVLVPVVVSGAGTDGGVCCNGLRCVAVALTPSTALSLGTQHLSISAFCCSTVPTPSGVLQLDLSPEFRNAVSWLCGFCFFGGWLVFLGLFVFVFLWWWRFYCFVWGGWVVWF